MSFSRLLHSYMNDVDLSEPDYQGSLTKRSRYLSIWRERYFILKGGKLYFLENIHKPPHGVIELQDCLTVASAEDTVNRKHCFMLKTRTEVFFLCAENKKSKDEWIARLGHAVVTHSSSYRSSALSN